MVEKPVLNNKGRVTGQREIRPVWNNAQRVNHQNKFTHPHPKRNFVPTTVVTKSGQVPVNTAKQSSPRVATSISTVRVNNVTTAGPKAVVSAAKGNGENAVKSSACWIWRPTGNVIDHTSKDSGSYMLKRFDYVDLQGRLNLVDLFTLMHETVYKEWKDRMERAATTASSLEAEQDSGNINRTQSMTTLNESIPQGTDSVYAARHTLTAVRHKLMLPGITCYCWIQALVDKKEGIISETSIRSDLQLDDAEGTDCLPTATIFVELERIGYENLTQKLTFYIAYFSSQWKFLIHTILQCLSAKTISLNELVASTYASLSYVLATTKNSHFPNTFLTNMVKNLDGRVKFLMYLRFVQVFLDKQVEGMLKHKGVYVTPSRTKKVFANMKRPCKGFSGRVTPLFSKMMVQATRKYNGCRFSLLLQIPYSYHYHSYHHPLKTSQKQKIRRKQRRGPVSYRVL
ncbi:hypothetical protein Tco_1273790 [Tanacetum coccineum]